MKQPEASQVAFSSVNCYIWKTFSQHVIKLNTHIFCRPAIPPLKSLQTINAGEGVETRENSNTVGGNAN